LINAEKQKTRDIFREAIYKLEAAQISGFEDKEVLKGKIFNKIKQKYQLDDDLLNELRNIFNEIDIIEKEDTYLDQRTENIVEVLRSIVKNNPNLCISNDYDIRNSIYASKQELKRYEKELESKAGQSNIAHLENSNEDFTMKNSFNLQNNNFVENPLSNQKTKSKIDMSEGNMNSKKLVFNEVLGIDDYPSIDYKEERPIFTNKIDDFILPNERSMNIDDGQKLYKLSNNLKISDDSVEKHKSTILQNLSKMAKTHEDMINETQKRTSNIYKSKVLNDLYMKLTLFNKLSEFEIQILIYLTQIVVKDIVDAKISERQYEGDLHPEDLIDLLKKFKNEIQSSGL